MGYCLFEHWLGAGIGVGTRRGAQAKARGAGARHSDTTRRRWGAAQRHDAQALGAGERGAAGRRRARRRGARGAGVLGRAGACGTQAWKRLGRGLSVLLGQQVVHSMHSACFDPVLTQYCS